MSKSIALNSANHAATGSSGHRGTLARTTPAAQGLPPRERKRHVAHVTGECLRYSYGCSALLSSRPQREYTLGHPAEYQAFFSRIDGKSALAFWQACPTPVEAAAADVNTLAQMLRAASHGRFTEVKAREKAASITRTARELSEAFATRASEQWSGWAEDIRMLSRHLSQINAYLAELTEQMEGVIEKIQSPLRGLKGLGTLSIAIIHGETGFIARFATADRFARYNGTAPREVSSGRSRQHCKNSQCNQHLRRILLQFALNAPRYHEESAAYQDRLRQRGITDGAARIRLARRWSDILYAILRHNRPYDVAIFRRDQAGKRPAA